MNNDLKSNEALKAYAREVLCGNNPTNSLLIRMFDEIIDNAPPAEPEKVLIANVTFDEDKLKEIVQTEVIDKIKSGELVLKDERPKGYWIGQNKDCRGYCDSFKCSECGALIYPNCVQTECDYPSCPFCLSDMRGEEE